jgi:hypothetical protein
MKDSSRLEWTWMAALLLTAVSLTGCRTSSAWRAESPKDDAPRVSKGKSMNAFVPATEALPCRFG